MSHFASGDFVTTRKFGPGRVEYIYPGKPLLFAVSVDGRRTAVICSEDDIELTVAPAPPENAVRCEHCAYHRSTERSATVIRCLSLKEFRSARSPRACPSFSRLSQE